MKSLFLSTKIYCVLEKNLQNLINMKKLLLLVIFLGTYSIAHPQSESIPDPLLVSINGVIDRQQSILGLCIIEYVVVNISDNPVLIY